MKTRRFGSFKNYGFEFLSIFIAVVAAFALNNWNDNRKADKSENKILTEILNGLDKDIEDLHENMNGHRMGMRACVFFRDVLAGNIESPDSVVIYYYYLTRDFISIQNIAGYETLKSKGLELIKSDSLRLQIISLYEYDYETLRKLEEDYFEMQFSKSYFREINHSLAPNFQFDDNLRISGFDLPLQIPDNDKKIFLLYLWKIQMNRNFILMYYTGTEEKIERIRQNIVSELER